MSLKNLVRPNILEMKAYTSARDDYNGNALVNLDANENPFGEELNRYPDPYQRELKEKIADWKNLDMTNLILGNGSDELIDLIIRAFCEPGTDEILTVKPTYGMYKVSASINNVKYLEATLNQDFSLNSDNILKVITGNTKVIFLCSPNNPTGNIFNEKEVEKILQNFNGVVVIDEAYVDFTESESWSKKVKNYPYLIVLQTFSKAVGLAGIRIGMGWASAEMIDVLNKIKPPYNINSLSQKSALKRLDNIEQIESQINEIILERKNIETELIQFNFVIKVFPSDSNFVLVEAKNANELYAFLVGRGIVVRNRSNQFGCANCIRISIGSKEDNQQLLAALNLYKS